MIILVDEIAHERLNNNEIVERYNDFDEACEDADISQNDKLSIWVKMEYNTVFLEAVGMMLLHAKEVIEQVSCEHHAQYIAKAYDALSDLYLYESELAEREGEE